MLQISTGKFFGPSEVEETLHRGTFFTNYRIYDRKSYETACGRLMPSAPWSKLITLTCETTERLAKTNPDGSQSILISIGSNHMLSDFAAITSFALNITCTLDPDLTRRLVSPNSIGPSGANAPQSYLKRMFDTEVPAKASDDAVLGDLVSKLMALDRKSYEGAIRAIRRFVSGAHRISDDIDLAYALFVASIESLAQDFDGFIPTWGGVAKDRREPIDAALLGVDEVVADRVRGAVMDRESRSLARRYREFALSNVQSSYFREDAREALNPVRRSDIGRLLDRAYAIRSRYVHRLSEIPRNVLLVHDHSETAYDDGERALTFQGIARLSRHIIMNFIEGARRAESEMFDWRRALPNITTMPVASQHWVWDERGYSAKSANRYLAGFLDQVASVLQANGTPSLSDMRNVLRKMEELVPGTAGAAQRRPMVLLHYLYYRLMADQFRSDDHTEFFSRFAADFDEPCLETAIAYIVFRRPLDWQLADAEAVYAQYYKQRHHRDGIHLNPFFEGALTLAVAALAAEAGNQEVALVYVVHAVENNPGDVRLVALETDLMNGSRTSFAWQEIWLPAEPKDPA
ncbi:MAG TPA: hypothetical protein VGV07_18235 [Devosia sp.]|jgi:hypothetical protein|uniref:hypothetical protein n=1 Tax=Devosia sp. TaxID=1871048 RepID=UPI002DDD641C|nr:hypothetical protein [Devosia sp.]HEV2517198.1 hypothetical protein [Devosia sp.]